MPLPYDRPLLEVIPGDAPAARLNARALGERELEHVRARLFDLAASHPGRRLRVDLGGLEHLGSTGLALLVGLHKRVAAGGGHLSLHGVRRPLYELLALTRLTSILDVRPRLERDGEPTAASA